MKVGYQQVISALAALDPAASSAVRSVTLHMANGEKFTADDVTYDGTSVIYARAPGTGDTWAMIPRDEIAFITAEFDYVHLEDGVDHTMEAIVKHGLKR